MESKGKFEVAVVKGDASHFASGSFIIRGTQWEALVVGNTKMHAVGIKAPRVVKTTNGWQIRGLQHSKPVLGVPAHAGIILLKGWGTIISGQRIMVGGHVWKFAFPREKRKREEEVQVVAFKATWQPDGPDVLFPLQVKVLEIKPII